MELKKTLLEGCFEIKPITFLDQRGTFTKTFHKKEFKRLGLNSDWKEDYYTYSKKDVIRGMHLQLPPSDHFKLVHCLHGEVLDVLLDLRSSSPSFGKTYSLKLSSKKKNSIYISKGIAHGFLSLTEKSLLTYKVSSAHSPEHDTGVCWNSFGYEWPVKNPIISDRDKTLQELKNFNSPF